MAERMYATRHGIDIGDVVERERRLARRAAALKLLVTVTGAASAVGFVLAFRATGDAIAALLAASPLVVTLLAAGWAFVTEVQLRRVGLLIAVLADDFAGWDDPLARPRRAGRRKALAAPPTV